MATALALLLTLAPAPLPPGPSLREDLLRVRSARFDKGPVVCRFRDDGTCSCGDERPGYEWHGTWKLTPSGLLSLDVRCHRRLGYGDGVLTPQNIWWAVNSRSIRRVPQGLELSVSGVVFGYRDPP